MAANESHARLSQNPAGVVEVTGKTFGLFHAVANPIYSWGVARKVTFPGVNIDVGYQRSIAASKDNAESIWIAYNRMRGQYASALEHAVPERFFNDPAKCNSYDNPSPTAGLPACPQGISAMKALSLAAAQGQKIYTVTKEVYQRNPNIVSTQLSAHSEQARSRIQNALNQGLEVTIHERPITESGWKGSGYILIDPSTGAGAYEIEGGAQGGWLSLAAAALEGIATIAVGALITSFFLMALGKAALVSVSFVAVVIIIAGIAYFLAHFYDKENPDHKYNYMAIKAMTILAGLHSRFALVWTILTTFRKYW
ncbi:hypothetical protein [Ottowia testudinis]|uniref:Uncharacterized protein n=1 Tax=Ottowia testudinis TaxID=2816950 RepID=A0A975H218_9BURK|nr:hypothetical protein [Ottowia testudinis]QTD43726.1 hypothetical protein J1M35_11190 [Ottowia testudinis]